jgi:hypothetical protein
MTNQPAKLRPRTIAKRLIDINTFKVNAIVVPEDESALRPCLLHSSRVAHHHKIKAYLPVVWIGRERVLLDVDENQ